MAEVIKGSDTLVFANGKMIGTVNSFTEEKAIKPNDVFLKDNEWYIVTELTNGKVSGIEKLSDYVSRSYVMPFKDEMLTINEIIDRLCQGFISG